MQGRADGALGAQGARGACVGSAGARWAGRAGARRASVLGRQAHGRGQALTGGARAAGWVSGSRRAGRGSRRADTAWMRGGARQAQAGARWAAGWAACARLVCAAEPGWVFWCT